MGEDSAWSDWITFAAEAVAGAPSEPGVYLFRQSASPQVIYVGSAGPRSRNGASKPRGIQGRLRAYLTGKGLVSGLGERAFDRALADPAWVGERLHEIEEGCPRGAKEWGGLAMRRAELEICWATTGIRAEAEQLEQWMIAREPDLWNLQRRRELLTGIGTSHAEGSSRLEYRSRSYSLTSQ
jgi:hypothetical protein